MWNKGKVITAANVELDASVELHASHWVLAVVRVLQDYEEATCGASGNYLWRNLILTLVCQE